jgi:4-hydroxy-tetrahydrodipicolinate synthase
MRQRSRSVWVPSIHPFNADSSLDEGGFRVHLQRLANAGLNVLVANEGSGESFTFSDAEMARVMEIAKEELHGKVIVSGMGRMVRKASDMIEFVRLVEEIGLDCVQIYALEMGHGLTPSVAEQERYLRDVLEHTHIPTVLSLHRHAGYSYPVDLLDRIVDDYPQIVGAIVTTNDVLYLWEVLEVLGERIEVHTHTWNAMTNLALGGDAFAAPEANLAPRLCASVMEHYTAGRYTEAEAAFLRVVRLWSICGKYGSARGTKAALEILGLPAGPVRLPRLGVNDDERATIARALDELGVRESEAIA